MSGYASESASWYVWFTELSILPPEFHDTVSMISSFFVILALTPIIPVVGLLIYDVLLWFWRLLASSWRAQPATPINPAGETPTLVQTATAANGKGATT